MKLFSLNQSFINLILQKSMKSAQTQTITLTKLQSIKQKFLFSQKICVKANPSKYICIHKQCTNKNPFVCSIQNCECFLCHQQCQQSTLKSFQKKIQRLGSEYEQLSDKINFQTDNLIDYISQRRQSIITLIKQGKAHKFFQQPSSPDQQNYLQEQAKQTKQQIKLYQQTLQIIGGNAYLVHNSILQKEYQQKLSKFKTKYEKESQRLKNKVLKQYFSNIQKKLLLNNLKNIWISKELSSKNNVIEGNVIKSTLSNACVDFTFLQPSIQNIVGNIIKWRVKILGLTNWIRIGVGLRQFLNERDFSVGQGWINEQQGGHYCLSSNGYVWAYQSAGQNNIKSGFSFFDNDIIQIQLNKQQNKLTFKKNEQKKLCQIKITYDVDSLVDEYYLCVGLWQPNDMVEVLSPIQVDGEAYQLIQKCDKDV